MKKLIRPLLFAGLIMVFSGFSNSDNAGDCACWGQATAVFARMGMMGEHASEQPTPRVGLRNLARYLADEGIIPDDSMQSPGEFVDSAYGLSIEAC